MRYIADSNGYLQEVSFGADITCGDNTCTEYTGGVPSGYTSLEAWYLSEADKLYRWKVVNGELTLDSSAVAPVDSGACIAEQGTSGNWTYEKWSSGIVKMYYTGTYSSAFNNGNYFGAYRGTAQTLNYPFTLASVTYANVDHVSPNTGFCLLSVLTNSLVTFYPYNRTNQTATQTGIKVIAEVVGRWK